MGSFWERRIRHIDRPVNPIRLGALRGQLLKAKVRALRGLPSRNLPSEFVFRRITLRAQQRRGSLQAAEGLAQLELAILRYRLAERRRAKRDAARRHRRRRVENTSINLWRRRRDWLLAVDPGGTRGGLVEGVSPLSNASLLDALGDDLRLAGLVR